MGMAVNGLCPPSAGLQRNQWCTFPRPAAAAFFLFVSRTLYHFSEEFIDSTLFSLPCLWYSVFHNPSNTPFTRRRPVL